MRSFHLLIGYLIGFTLFCLLGPSFLVFLSKTFDGFWKMEISLTLSARLAMSVPVFIPGLVFAVWSNIGLLVTGKGGPTDVFNHAISPRTQKLVVTGAYKYSRNPMVFGMLCMYLSITVFLLSLSCLLFWLVLFLLVRLYVKKVEEPRLLKDFGQEFLEYRSRVSLLVPWVKSIKRIIAGAWQGKGPKKLPE